MNKIFTFKRFVAAIALIFTATLVMNAQTQENPWHVVVYDDNGKEVANHSVEIIDTVTLSAQDVNFLLSTGTTYLYPRTSMFSFDRRAGNGTAIETIAAPQWSVYYSGSNLHFTEQVNGIAVYTVYGTLVTRSSGKNTDFPVSLMQGIYIVQAGGKSTKLLVTSNSSGTSSIQPDMAPIRPQTSYAPSTTSPPELRASTAALKEWWNVNAGNTITPIEIAKVDDFYIAPNNAIIFFMKDGNTVQLDDYQGTSVSTQPTASQNIDWDVAKTILYGGATYSWQGPYTPAITWAAIHKNGIAYHTVMTDNSYSEDQRFANSAIPSALWDAGNNPNSRLSMFGGSPWGYGMSYPDILQDTPIVRLMDTNGITHTVRATEWPYNNNSNLIPTTFVKGVNSMTMTCTDYTGKTWSYTFNTW